MLVTSLMSGQCRTAADGSSSIVDLHPTTACTAAHSIQEEDKDAELPCRQQQQQQRAIQKVGTKTKTLKQHEEEDQQQRLSSLLHLKSSTTDFRERVPSQDESSTSSFSSCSTGPVAGLAEAFEKVLYNNHDHQQLDLSVSALVEACRLFEINLKSAGLHQSAADLHQNLNKVNSLLQQIPDDYYDQHQQQDSLRQVLLYEKDVLQLHSYHHTTSNKNSNNNNKDRQVQLQEKSGAVGFLWIRRSLQFNEHIYNIIAKQHLVDNNNKTREANTAGATTMITPRDATLAAYHAVLKPYHNWFLRHIFTLGIRALSPLHLADFLGAVGGFLDDKNNLQKQQETLHDFSRLVEIWKPLLQTWQNIFEELDLEDRRKV